MTVHNPVLLLVSALIAVLLAPSVSLAADVPMRKSGLWEIRTETTAGGQKAPGPMTMQMCIVQNRDDMTADPRDRQDVRRHCSKMDMTRSGNKVTVDSVCKHDGYTATGHTVISGNLATDYRMENTTRFDPSMQGMQTLSSTMTGKWLGPCKPGQTHGSVTLSGMPGMPPGAGFRMDPEMMKRIQQMQ
jgi:hypothetical protein